jgi:hypothetical protein
MHVRSNARLSDEIMMFLFDVEPTFINQIGTDANDAEIERFIATMLNPSANVVAKEEIVADVERAFIKMLRTKYNDLRYDNYPMGKGGVYGSGLDRYCYGIAENITFRIGDIEIVGGYIPNMPISNEADFIFIEGDHVELVDISKVVKANFS